MVSIIISIFVYIISWRAVSALTRNCIVISKVSTSQLMDPVDSLYLVTAKLFPVINTRYATHWSIIAKTANGYFNISTARYMSIYIYPVVKDDAFHFLDTLWNTKLHILKKYSPISTEKPINVYSIALSAMNFYNTDNKLSYSMINHNCQHVAQYIIQTFGKVDKDDPFMVKLKGMALFKKSCSDALRGPKVLL